MQHMDKAINASVRQALVGKWGGRDEIGYMVDLRVAGCCEMYGDDTCAPDRCFTGYGWRYTLVNVFACCLLCNIMRGRMTPLPYLVACVALFALAELPM